MLHRMMLVLTLTLLAGCGGNKKKEEPSPVKDEKLPPEVVLSPEEALEKQPKKP